MEQHEKIYRRRFYTVVIIGVLFVVAWLFVKGVLTPLGLAAAGMIYMASMFVALLLVTLSFQRSAREFRGEQIAKGISAESFDRERYVKSIRSLKRLIVLFAVLFVWGVFATQGDPLMTRVGGLGIDGLFLSSFVYSLIRLRKKLKGLSEGNEKP